MIQFKLIQSIFLYYLVMQLMCSNDFLGPSPVICEMQVKLMNSVK